MIQYAIKITVKPVPKGRARKGRGGFYTPKPTRSFEQIIRGEFMAKHRKPCLEGPLELYLRFIMPVPLKARDCFQRIGQPHSIKPDVDNLVKAVKDALKGIAWIDDAQVAELTALKVWGHPGSVSICVRPLTEPMKLGPLD